MVEKAWYILMNRDLNQFQVVFMAGQKAETAVTDNY